jgi:hypothetical protein
MSINYNQIILDQPQDGGNYGAASSFYDAKIAGNPVDIFDEASAKSEFTKAVLEQDYGTINRALRVSQMMLRPESFVATINEAIDSLPPDSKEWYVASFGNGYRLVEEAGGYIPPYVAQGRAVND